MKKFYIILFLIFCCFSHSSFSQRKNQKITKFTPLGFPEEITFFLQKSKKKDGKKIGEKFAKSWIDFVTEDQDSIVVVANKMLSKRMKAFPYFEKFLMIVMELPQAHSDSYIPWISSLDYFLSDKGVNSAKFFINMTYGLLFENSVFESSSIKWKSNSKNFVFSYNKKYRKSKRKEKYKLVKLDFGSMDLVCHSRGDSSKIYNTKGSYFPINKLFYGRGGKVTWERVGFSMEDVFVDLPDSFKLDLTKSSYKIKNVSLTNKFYFKTKLKGDLHEKLKKNANKVEIYRRDTIITYTAVYPRFYSYSKRLKINQIYAGVDYEGGFTLKGAKFVVANINEDSKKPLKNEEAFSYLHIYKDGNKFLKIKSPFFVFKKNKTNDPITGEEYFKETALSKDAAITFYLNKDSIYHPSVEFKYFVNTGRVVLYRNGKGMSISPYFNTYHDYDMDFELLSWNINEEIIEFKTLFKEALLSKKKDLSEQDTTENALNPITTIRDFSKKYRKKKFLVAEFADFINEGKEKSKDLSKKLEKWASITKKFEKEKDTLKLIVLLKKFAESGETLLLKINADQKEEEKQFIEPITELSRIAKEIALDVPKEETDRNKIILGIRFLRSEATKISNYLNIETRKLLIELARDGFIFYNDKTQIAVIQDRLYDYFSANKAEFMSANYFSQNRFMKLQGRDARHPLILIKMFAREYDTDEFYASSFASYIRKPSHLVRQLLMRLAFEGFLNYNSVTQEVKIKQRLYDYIEKSRGRLDYDVISIKSETESTLNNAFLNLENMDLVISGVDSVNLSTARDLVIYPETSKLLLKEGGNFDFDGRIRVGTGIGSFEYYGNNFSFKYDSFKIDMDNIDYMKVRLNYMRRKNNELIKGDIESLIEKITGDLLIDNPNNKSGVDTSFTKSYPVFNSRTPSYVYYDDEKIYDGVYDKDKFYFEINPFQIDSLMGINNPGKLKLSGNFSSGNIFPDFEDTLTIQIHEEGIKEHKKNIYSFGFKRPAPEDGFPAYEDKGRFYSEVSLSNKGLQGKGTLEYLTSTSTSDEFTFFPDSVNGRADSFYVKKQKTPIEYPMVKTDTVEIHWEPHNDRLFSTKRENQKPFIMYEGLAVLNNTILVEPDGLKGWGTMKLRTFNNSYLTVKPPHLFIFKMEDFTADTSDLVLRSTDSLIAIRSDNVKAKVDFTEKKSEFVCNDSLPISEFIQTKYISNIPEFSWLMEDNIVKLPDPESSLYSDVPDVEDNTTLDVSDLVGATYTSIHQDKDSLKFVSPHATYSLQEQLLVAEEVKLVRVADAIIFPIDEKIIVERYSKMRTLYDAKIIANNNSKYHTFDSVAVDINSKFNYMGKGIYTYIDEESEEQIIHFDTISVDSLKETVAIGEIFPQDEFFLSPNFAFSGEVKAEARKQFLTFTGGTKINHECDSIMSDTTWIAFSGEIDPNDILIPIPQLPKDKNKKDIFASTLMVESDSTYLYSTFLTPSLSDNETTIFYADGFLHYNKEKGIYQISKMEKLAEPTYPANLMSLKSDFCFIHTEGDFDMGVDLGQVKLKTVGVMNHDMPKSHLKFEVMMGVDFIIEEKATELLAKTIKEAKRLKDLDMTSEDYVNNLAEYIGWKEKNKMVNDIILNGLETEVPDAMKQTIVFADLNLVWNTETHSYKSDGKIGIANIGEIPINKYVKGNIEIVKKQKTGKKSRDKIHIYLNPERGKWFYFVYDTEILATTSGVSEYNTIINDVDKKKRKLKVAKGEAGYSYFPATSDDKEEFLENFYSEEAPNDETDDENKDDENKDDENKDDENKDDENKDDENKDDENKDDENKDGN